MAFYKKPAPVIPAKGRKRCPRCNRNRSLKHYRIKATGRVNKMCNDCCDQAMALFTKHNTDGGGKHYARHNELLRAKRRRVIEHYGGKCCCCGEANYEFLALDHENGGGNKHRRTVGDGGTNIVLWVTRNNFPPGFRVLCHNCNNAIKNHGICPHRKPKGELAN